MARFQVHKINMERTYGVVAVTSRGRCVLYLTDEEIIAQDFAARMNAAFECAMIETYGLIVIAAQGEV